MKNPFFLSVLSIVLGCIVIIALPLALVYFVLELLLGFITWYIPTMVKKPTEFKKIIKEGKINTYKVDFLVDDKEMEERRNIK